MKPRITLDERASDINEAMRAAPRSMRLDANETMLFARSLEQIEARLFEVKYPEGHAIELMPLNTSIDPGADQYTYSFQNFVGEAKRVVNWSSDFPRVDIQGDQIKNKMQNYGASFGYDLQQLRAAKFANYMLEQQLNVSARRAVMRKLDSNLWFGDTDIGVHGLANSALVSPTAVITGTWASATSIQIVADAQKLISAPVVASKGVEETDTVIFSTSIYELVARRFMGNEAPGMTVLDMLKKANPGVAFFKSYKLELADAGGTKPRAIAFRNDREKLEGLVATEFEVLPAIDLGGQFEVKVMGRFGGVAIRYPGSVAYMDSLVA